MRQKCRNRRETKKVFKFVSHKVNIQKPIVHTVAIKKSKNELEKAIPFTIAAKIKYLEYI